MGRDKRQRHWKQQLCLCVSEPDHEITLVIENLMDSPFSWVEGKPSPPSCYSNQNMCDKDSRGMDILELFWSEERRS